MWPESVIREKFPKPQKLLTSHILICEHVLNEKDDVFSVIRLVDLFTIRQPLPEQEKAGVQISALVQLKSQIGDNQPHSFRLDLVRPNGETTLLMENPSVVIESKASNAPGGANLIVNIGVLLKQMGTHYFTLMVDGEEACRAPFTLRLDEASND
jgi:hypothetical protein